MADMTTQKRSRFWLKLTLFVLPFAVAFLAVTGVMMYLGESMPLRWVVWHQQQDDVLFRYRYGNRDPQFKQLSVNVRQPDVLALGSSRILQFRAGFINENSDVFYNAAGPAWRLPQVVDLVKGIDKAALPEILILAVDLPWFHEDYASSTMFDEISDFQNVFAVNRSVMQDVINGIWFGRTGFDTQEFFAREEPGGSGKMALGMRAIRDGHGFRSDGSEQYGDFLIAEFLWQPQQRENHLEWMRNGENMYLYGDTYSQERLAMLEDLLAYTAEHDVFVVGYLPAYMPGLWVEMQERGNHTYKNALRERLPNVFAQYGYPLFDYSDGSAIGLTDEDFYDGWHISELGNLRIYTHMLQYVPELQAYSDRDALLDIINSATSTWDVFGMNNVPGDGV